MESNHDNNDTVRKKARAIPEMFRSDAEQSLKAAHVSTIEWAKQTMKDETKNPVRIALAALGDLIGAHQVILWSRGWMLEYFQAERAAHEAFLRKSWPGRCEAFDEAFFAARNGQYRSAILMLFPQIEYVCQERIGEKFFALTSLKGGTMTSKAYQKLKKSRPLGLTRILEVLSEYSPLYCSEDKVVSGIVNRHQVVHGNDDTFGTELNYFRCISIAVFLTRYANQDGK